MVWFRSIHSLYTSPDHRCRSRINSIFLRSGVDIYGNSCLIIKILDPSPSYTIMMLAVFTVPSTVIYIYIL